MKTKQNLSRNESNNARAINCEIVINPPIAQLHLEMHLRLGKSYRHFKEFGRCIRQKVPQKTGTLSSADDERWLNKKNDIESEDESRPGTSLAS